MKVLRANRDHRYSRRGRLLRPVTALLLCLVMLTGMIPWSFASDAAAASPGKPVTNTYLFEASTGIETGTEDKIEFFIIHYIDTNNLERTQLLCPYEDSMKEGFETALTASDWQKNRDDYIKSNFGYTPCSLTEWDAFQPLKTDQYLFTTPVAIKSVNQIQIFTAGAGSWNCQGMRVFRVDTLGGLYRYNDAARDRFIDFDGALISEARFSDSIAQAIGWDSDKLINIGGRDAMLNSSLAGPGSQSYVKHSRIRSDDLPERDLALQFTFADVYGGGLETLSTLHGEKDKTIKSIGKYECLALSVRYKDIYGSVRVTEVPAVINAILWATTDLGISTEEEIVGLAQQGEALVTAFSLPEAGSAEPMNEIVATLGTAAAEKLLKLSPDSKDTARKSHTELESKVKTSSDNENVCAFILNAVVYDLKKTAVTASLSEEALTVRWTFTSDPILYHVAESGEGEPLQLGSTTIMLRTYTVTGQGKTKPTLKPRDASSRNKYLITVITDTVPVVGTPGDIYVKINYNDMDGTARSTAEFRIRAYAMNFYGFWPGTDTGDFAYYNGMAPGQALYAIVPIQDIKTLTGISVRYDSADRDGEWQMKDFILSAINPDLPVGLRTAKWETYESGSFRSDRIFSRFVDATPIYTYSEKFGDVPQLYHDDEIKDISGAISEDVITYGNIDWSQLQYSMTYEEACQNFGFSRQRYTYLVTVDVAPDSIANGENGNSGSKALFYFRLVFQYGKTSGYVLANQQLHSDGFRADTEEQFYITTNQDYGDVVAVQVIPDYFSGQTDVFDKLHVDSIRVSKQTNSAVCPTWTASSVGWIDIDYRDEYSQPIGGMKGRSSEEVTHTYTMDSKSYDVNLMVAISTGDYQGKQQFRGSISAVVYYKHSTPDTAPATISDLVKSMYDYMGRAPVYSDALGGLAVSDTSWMFRANHTDRFFMTLRDVESITRIELMVRSENNTIWNIDNISIFQVQGEGSLIRNINNEYEYKYKPGQELLFLTKQNVETNPAYSVSLHKYSGTTVTGETDVTPVYINFTENKLVLSPEADQWKSVITREPAGQNDTLNVFLYPEIGGGNSDAADYDLSASFWYTDTMTDIRKTATGTMRKRLYRDQPVFYATGITASGLVTLNSASVRTVNSDASVICAIERAVIQQVRNGVVIHTWEMTTMGGNAQWEVPLMEKEVTTRERQTVRVQLGSETQGTLLYQEQKDLAIAIWYRSDDPSNREYRSPYIYLTDQGITSVRPGQMLEVTFNQASVDRITGISLVSFGETDIKVDGAYAEEQLVSGSSGETVTVKGTYSFATPIEVTNVPKRMNPSGNLKPLYLTFVTGDPAESAGGGTDGPVRMTLGYYDRYGDIQTVSVEDLRQYLVDEDRIFDSSSSRTAQLLVDDLVKVRWIQVEPWHTVGDDPASWTVARVIAEAEDMKVDRAVNVTVWENEPYQIIMANTSLKISVSVTSKSGMKIAYQGIGGEAKILTRSGDTVTITPEVIGSNYGWSAKAERMVSGFPADADSTIKIKNGDLVFTAPANTSASTAEYWITLTLDETPAVKMVVKIGVESGNEAADTGEETSSNEIVRMALSQVGNSGDVYWSYMGFSKRVDWCACFVSWCANECGYIKEGILPNTAGCVSGERWFRERGQWRDSTYTPKAGDIIYFDWDSDGEGQDGAVDHVGIVEKVEGDYIYTIEGNSGDKVSHNAWKIGHYEIYGFGCPAY